MSKNKKKKLSPIQDKLVDDFLDGDPETPVPAKEEKKIEAKVETEVKEEKKEDLPATKEEEKVEVKEEKKEDLPATKEEEKVEVKEVKEVKEEKKEEVKESKGSSPSEHILEKEIEKEMNYNLLGGLSLRKFADSNSGSLYLEPEVHLHQEYGKVVMCHGLLSFIHGLRHVSAYGKIAVFVEGNQVNYLAKQDVLFDCPGNVFRSPEIDEFLEKSSQ